MGVNFFCLGFKDFCFMIATTVDGLRCPGNNRPQSLKVNHDALHVVYPPETNDFYQLDFVEIQI